MNPISDFLAYIETEKRYSMNTVQAYKMDLEQFFLFLKVEYDNPNLLEISHLHIRSWLAAVSDSHVKSRSLNRKISTLKSFFNYLLRHNVIERTPMTKVISPKNEKRLPVFVNQNNMDTLLRHIEFNDDFNGKTERLIVELLYQTGIRRSELLGLKVDNINLFDRTIKVLGKGNKERIIPIISYLCDLIKSYIEERKLIIHEEHGYLFVLENGKKLYENYIYRVVKKYLSMTTTLDKRSPHVLRHTFATHLLNGGADLNAVKELLGHANLVATQVYTHNSIDRLKEIHKKAHPKA